MNETKIEWVKNPDGTQGYTWNPITGCLNHVNGMCKGGGFPCYAYRLAHGRLSERYKANKNIAPVHNAQGEPYHLADDAIATFDPFYPRFWPRRLGELIYHGGYKAKGIFVCDMGELFGDWVQEDWLRQIFAAIKCYPQHRFYLLTKQPQNLIKFSPFPDNCWVGVTATNFKMFGLALFHLASIQASVKYISLEPLQNEIVSSEEGGYNEECLEFDLKNYLDWLIIGAQTKPYKPPRKEWIDEIVDAAARTDTPVFLKDNLRPALRNVYGAELPMRQELPDKGG